MTKLEEVARALYALDARDQRAEVDWARFRWTPNMRAYYFQRARAAIEAIREPTKEMCAAVWHSGADEDCDDHWRGMIDAILSEGKTRTTS